MTQSINAQQALDQTDYMKLFMQELTWQDPMKPVDNKEFMTQMAQFSALQQQTTSNDLLQKILQSQIANQSLTLLGKRVKIAGTAREGQVTKISFDGANPLLTVALSKDLQSGTSGEIVRINLHEIVDISKGYT